MSGTRNSLDETTIMLLGLLAALLSDIAKHHPHLTKTLQQDFKTICNRSKTEGKSFLTQTLPKLAKAIYRSLEKQVFECPSNFSKCKGTSLPRLFSGLMKSVFHDDGLLRVDFEVVYLIDILQILQLFYKLDVPYSPSKENNVIQAFKQTEKDLQELEIDENDVILSEARDLIERILHGYDPMEITPQHGPGAVATRERGLEKWNFKRKYNCIHRVYPYYTYFTPSRESLLRSIPLYRELESLDSGTAKVVLVPKDSRGPRLISMEPLEFQFIQQGIARSLVKQLEHRSSITRGKLNFTDQGINRELALHNSCTRSYATLDMKEASDRVSLQLVRILFSNRQDVLQALEATRTCATELPTGEILPLRKFAPMGSALCFPVEALCFFALCETVRKKLGVKGSIYVYGDDLIVPRDIASVLFKLLPKYGLKFNEDKCFSDGYFRESCGLDAYKGFVCTPIRMKTMFPSSRKQASQIVSGVELSNSLFLKGYWRASSYVENLVNKVIRINSLRSPKENFGGLSFVAFTIKGVITEDRVRFNQDIQRFETRTFIASSFKHRSNCENHEGRLFKNLLGRHQDDWEFTVVPRSTIIQRRWCTLY